MKTKFGRKALGIATAAIVLTGVAACAPGAATTTPSGTPNLGTYTFMTNPGSLPNLAVYVGVRMHFFEKYGIQPELVNATSVDLTLRLLDVGQMNFAQTSFTTPLIASKKTGTEIQYVAGATNTVAGAIVCRADAGIPDGYADGFPALKGHTLAMTSAADMTTRLYYGALDDSGLAPEDVNLIYVAGSGPMTAALQSGATDCGWLNYPGPSLLGEGYVTIMDMTKPGEFPESQAQSGALVLTTQKQFAEDHPDVIDAVQKAMIEITDYIGDPDNSDVVAYSVLNDFPGFTVDQLSAIIKDIAASYDGAGLITEDGFNAAIASYNEFAPQLGLDPDTLSEKYSDVVWPQQGQ